MGNERSSWGRVGGGGRIKTFNTIDTNIHELWIKRIMRHLLVDIMGREIFGTECRSKRRKKEENDARGKTFGTGKVTQKKMIVSWVFDLREKLKKEQGQIFERNYFGSDQEHTEKRWWIQKKMIQGGFFDWSALKMSKYEEKLKYLNWSDNCSSRKVLSVKPQ